ncbi:MAG TPA: EAL domain-containing protein [Burkholderiales bacterium]
MSDYPWAYLDADGIVRECSLGFAECFGLARADLLNRNVHDAVGPVLYPPFGASLARAMGEGRVDFEGQVRDTDGTVARWFFCALPQTEHASGNTVGLHLLAAQAMGERGLEAAVEGVTERLLPVLAGAPRASGGAQPDDRFRELMALACDWFWVQDAEGLLTKLEGSHGDGTSGLTGRFRQSFLGHAWQEIDSDTHSKTDWEGYNACLARRSPFKHILIKQHLPDRSERWIEVSGTAQYGEAGRFCGYHGIAQDVTLRVQAEQQVAQMAFQDPLTRLPNRTLVLDRLRQAISLSRRSKKTIAVFFIDLDNFKAINDGLGHHAGDEVLKTFVSRARSTLREADTIGRMGGDEFLTILPDLPESRPAIRVAEAILTKAREAILVDGSPVVVAASIGVAVFPEDGSTAEKLIQCADIAMYEAKRNGRNRVCFFHDTMQQKATKRLSITSDLRQALSRSEFFLCYQPIVELGSGQLVGAETLVRWRRNDTVTVNPDDFIPSAEELGIIDGIGMWIIEQACLQLRIWQGLGIHLKRLSINVSPRQLRQKNFADEVGRVISHVGINPHVLELEITEGVLMDSSETTVHNLNKIRRLGVRLCIDDFGTGFSNLSYVIRHSFDTLKLDRYFVSRIPADRASFAIVRSVCALAKELGIEVIAEGVEKAEQREALAALECRVGQGFFWNAPLSVGEFSARYPGGGSEARLAAPSHA